MRTGRFNQIGVIVPKINSDSVSQITQGIAEELRKKNYITMLGCTENVDDRETSFLDIMQGNQAAGIILMGTVMTPNKADILQNSKIPVVITGQSFEGFACVFHDDFNAVRDLTAYMIGKGKRRIAYLGVTEEDAAAGVARRKGAQAAVKEAGLNVEEMPCVICGFDCESGYLAMKELLAEHREIDGVICATDRIALGAMAAIREAGIRIPEDIAIAGVGDSWAGLASDPKLTSVHLHYKKCGRDAADMLLDMIEQREEDRILSKIMLGYHIVERGSV